MNKPVKFESTLKKYPKLGLINFEGDVVKAYKVNDNGFIIVDGHGEYIRIYTRLQLDKFLNGEIVISISSGETFNYLEQHQDARPKQHQLDEFLKETDRPKKVSKESAKTKLIKLLTSQIADLTMMSKIELGDDVIAEIVRLKKIINE